MKKNTRSKAFTLVELLTVIAIIAVLAGLLFPAIKIAMLDAEKTKAKTTIAGLSTAFRAYYTEYGKWPVSDGVVTGNYLVDTNMIALLSGKDINTLGVTTKTCGLFGQFLGNPRGIVFLEFKQADIGSSPTLCFGSGNFLLDPWKRPYHYSIDVFYWGTVPDPFVPSVPITTGFLIWSDGPDGQEDNANGDNAPLNKDNIKSW